MWESFSVISKLTVVTCLLVDYSRGDFFLYGTTESKQVTESVSVSKNNI